MDNLKVASELIRLAKSLIAQRELRIMELKDYDKNILDLDIVMKGSMKKLNNWAREQGFEWKRDRGMMFGGYWVDPKTKDAYLIT